MRAILMIIKPKWVEKIASGEKTVEVRKTVPKCGTPFKVYIYETKAQYVTYQKGALTKYGYGKGKVVGEFVCDEIIVDEKGENQDIICENACLTRQELMAYEPRKTVYGLHISDLKIYDTPKELSEFETTVVIPKGTQWFGNKYADKYTFNKKLTRPPQSWQYVEDRGIEE